MTEIIYTNFVRNMCRLTTGNEAIRPDWWKNDTCPECGLGFEQDQAIAVDENIVVHHYDCLNFPKPYFTYQT